MKPGNLPEGWEWRALGEICKITIGGTPKRKVDEYWGVPNPWVSISELDGSVIYDTKEHITDLGVSKSNAKLIPKDTVLMSFKLSIGKVGIAGRDLYTNEAIAGLIIKDHKIVDSKFLFYIIPTMNFQKYGQGAAKGNCLNKKILETLKIPLPPLPTQHRIVEILEKADAVRRKRRLADEKTSWILQAAFVKMFGDPMRNEMEWEVKRLCDVCDTTSGGTPRRNVKEYYNGGTPWVKSGEVNNRYIYDTEEKISDAGLKNSSAKLFKINTVLVAMYGATAGKVALLKINATTNQAICGITPNKELIHYHYLHHCLESLSSRLISQTVGSGQPNLSQKIIRNLKIPIPPIELQQKFANLVEKVEAVRERQTQSREHIEETYQALMQKAFRGKLVA
ncbi:MAG: restriction endonuclease subunit S [Thermodesulfobacteriota bacterium]